MKKEEIEKIVKEEIQKMQEAGMDYFKQAGAWMKKNPGKPVVPSYIIFPKEVKDYFKDLGHMKLVKRKEGTGGYILFISPDLKAALDMLQRGRSVFTPSPSLKDPEKFTGTDIIDLSKQASEKIPANVRAILKNYTSKINSSVNMFPVEAPVKTGLAKGPLFLGNKQIADIGDIVFIPPVKEA